MDFRSAYDPGRALRSAWGLFSKWPVLFVGPLLLFLTGEGKESLAALAGLKREAPMRAGWHVPSLPDWERWPGVEPIEAGMLLLAGLASLLLALAFLLVNTLLHAGFASSLDRALGGATPALGDLLESRGRFFHLLATRILVWSLLFLVASPLVVASMLAAAVGPGAMALVTLAGLILVLPALVWVWLGLVLAPMAAAVEGLRPVDALQRSWSLVRGNRARLLIYFIAFFITQLLGTCLCCVGILFTGSWTVAAQYESYFQLVRGPVRPE